MVRWKFIAYNPQSLKRADRERRVIHALHSNDVIALSGTRLPDGDIAVSQRRVETHAVYSWGYGTGRLTNSHAGVQLCLKRSRFAADNVVQISSPPSELQGRGGALRVKRRDSDFAFIVCYFHPNSNLPYSKRVNTALWKWVDSVVSALPARCVPCLLGDFNARVGKEHVANNIWTTTQDESIGPCNADNENWNGEQFRQFLQRHYLAATNTYHNVGPTYFGIVADYTSRVDFICIPSSMLSQVQHCSVWHHTGDDLQLVAAPGRRDHRPLQIKLDHSLGLQPTLTMQQQSPTRWDMDRLMRGVLRGHCREQLVAEVESRCKDLLESSQWQHAQSASTPDDAWTMLRDVVLSVGRELYQSRPVKLQERKVDTAAALEHQHECKLQIQRLPRPRRFWSQGADRDTVSLQALSDLLCRWHALARYHKAQRLAKRLTTRDKRRRACEHVHQLHEGWQSANFQSMWRAARALSGRRVGPKQRRFDRPKSCRPSMQQWRQHMAQVGRDGGCKAVATNWTAHVQQFAHGATGWQQKCRADPVWRSQMQQLAAEDLRAVATQVWHAKTRKAVPCWTIPNEVWRMLLYPNYNLARARHGLGHKSACLQTPHLQNALQQLFVHIRCSESAPLEWHCSQGTQLDKRNGKPLCQGIRVINVLDPMGKHFYRTLWRRGTSQAARDYACGYVRHKSREEAILQQICLGHRLRAAGVGHATLYKDVANAFYSPLHDQLDLAVAKTMRPQDQVLLKQRHKAACIHLQAADGPILLSVGSGALQGDSIASDLFMEQYHPLVDEWLQRAAQASTYHQMCAYDPVNCKYVNTALSVFADDLAIKVICDEAADLQAQASFLDDELDEVLASGGMAQNRDKQEIVSHFAGRGSHKQMREIYCGKTPLEGKAVPQAKYLGEICTHNGSTTAARKHRLDKAQAAWASMGSFWTRTGCSKRSVNMVFRALVFETAVAGLAPFVLSQSDYKALDAFVAAKGRILMRGSACKREEQPDGTVKYAAVPNQQVWRYLGLAGVYVELRIKRLQFWQRLLRQPELHSNVFAAMFGFFPFETTPALQEDGSLSSAAHPWLKQLVDDIEALQDIADLEHITNAVDRKPLRLFSHDVRLDFLMVDMSILRRKFLCVEIPPPGYQSPSVQGEQAPEDLPDIPDDEQHVCEHTLSDGSLCGRAFKSSKALAIHCTKLHEHSPMEALLVVTNQCLFCREVFANVFSTRRHVANSLLQQHCSGRSSVVNKAPDIPDNLDCSMCDAQFETLEALHDHLGQHLGAQL